MDPDRWRHVRDIVERSLDLDGGSRRRYLEETCGQNADLRAEVERLLAADEDSAGLSWIVEDAVREAPGGLTARGLEGQQIGPYRLLRLVASGGMGAVYEAEQDEPRRHVALKTLRLEFDSEEARRRFRYESEILGRLSHDGIAKIHSTGTHRESEIDIPWFAMEFVEGARSIVRFVTDEGLDRGARLALFVEVCEAVHHGHEKGVVHRDLKPGNILVNDSGRVKVIDFGVARVADADFGVSLLQTRTGQIVGTMKYMSPEQVAGVPEDIDVRTDVFALGLVLSEVLTGGDCRDLSGLSFTAATRAIQAGTIPRLRAIDARQPEELEWIVGKAAAVDRRERYASAMDLAKDLRRFLNREPLEAAAPSTIYLARKFVARHRTAVAFVAVVVLLLTAALVGTTVGLQREKREREKAEALNEFLESMFSAVSPMKAGHDVRVVEILDAARDDVDERFGGKPALKADILSTLGQAYVHLGREASAEPLMRERLQLLQQHGIGDEVERVVAMLALGLTLSETRALEEAATLLHDAAAAADGLPGVSVRTQMQLVVYRAKVLRKLGRHDEALAVVRAGIARHCPDGIEVPFHAYLHDQLALLLKRTGQVEAAHRTQEMLYTYRRERVGSDDPDLLGATINYAQDVYGAGRADEALALFADIMPRCDRVFGPGHRTTLIARTGYAELLAKEGRSEEAVDVLAGRVEAGEAALGPADPIMMNLRELEGGLLGSLGRDEEAEPILRRQLELSRKVERPDPFLFARATLSLGMVLSHSGRTADAEPVLRDAYARAVELDQPLSLPYSAAAELVRVLKALGKTDELDEWRKKRDAARPSGP